MRRRHLALIIILTLAGCGGMQAWLNDGLERLTELRPIVLYAVLALAAAVENIFPPFPADTVVAFGSFLAAQGEASATGSFLSTWFGNIAGAMMMYFVGRRFGAAWIERKMAKGSHAAGQRFETLYGRYGLGAIFISRFLPGVRALVPPLAGAFRVPPVRALIMIALASGIWYALVTYLGYTVGSSWEELLAAIKASQKWLAAAAGAIVLIVASVWLVRRRARRPRP
jgi:membrane protein DedA with SNARE-associated domain